MADAARRLRGQGATSSSDVLKIGRTQLQDAVPMTLGQEFSTYAIMIGEDEARLREARALIEEINLGATAIGTGINAPAGYADLVVQLPGRGQRRAGDARPPNLVEATQDTGAFVQLSGVLKRVACKLQGLQRPAAAVVAARRPASATSSCRRARPARRSCRAR